MKNLWSVKKSLKNFLFKNYEKKNLIPSYLKFIKKIIKIFEMFKEINYKKIKNYINKLNSI